MKSERESTGSTFCADLAFRCAAMLLSCVSLVACSKTVAWEEEVPLNTGETIWVTRSVVYSLQGGAGNPLDVRYRPDRAETIEFTWDRRKFTYHGDARVLLLAISPQRIPVLVAKAADNSWDAVHRYACTLPFYVELVPQPDGRTWTWPPSIETWLYGLHPNLLLSRHSPDRMLARYTAQQRTAEDASGAVGVPSQARIDPDYTGDICRKPRRK
jgi:hypothetical protein